MPDTQQPSTAPEIVSLVVKIEAAAGFVALATYVALVLVLVLIADVEVTTAVAVGSPVLAIATGAFGYVQGILSNTRTQPAPTPAPTVEPDTVQLPAGFFGTRGD
jgi:hypothetical protein